MMLIGWHLSPGAVKGIDDWLASLPQARIDEKMQRCYNNAKEFAHLESRIMCVARCIGGNN